jgi:amidohydrolase family protein
MLVADEFGFKVRTFQHVLEGYRVADEMARHGAGGSTFSDWWAYKMEAYEAIPYNAALMTRRGVIVSINSDDAEEARHLNQEAAKSMKYGGLTENEALRLVTINPAIQLGVDKRVGSIETGKDADLVIYNHPPLSVYAVPQKVFIDGHMYFDREKDLAMRAENEKERQALIEKEKKAADAEKKSDEGKGKPGADKKPGAPPSKDAKPKEPVKPPQDATAASAGLD